MSSAGNTTVTRRLAAILIADVVGYTRLMERDDTGTFARLRTVRDEIVDPAVVSHDGRIVKTAGDGFLAEFPSALAALRASVQIQREMAKRNANVAADDRLDYRIGVNLGDIMIDGSDIAGDGINVASRLEALAEAGGICVSGSVWEQVHGQLDISFADIGEQRVKNIERPIRVYRIDLARESSARAGGVPTAPRPGFRRRRVVAAIGALVLLAVGVWAITATWRHAGTATATPPPFSIAILPFTAASPEPSDIELATRLSNDVAITLTEWVNRRGHVASVSGIGSRTGARTDEKTIGRDLNVANLVWGEISRTNGSLVVSLRVVDPVTGTQSWGERTSFTTTDLAADPAIVVKRVAWHLRTAIYQAEVNRAAKRQSSQQPIDLVLRGDVQWDTSTSTLEGIRRARKFYDEALRVDPDYVPAMNELADALHWELYENPATDQAQLIRELDTLTRRAVAVGYDNPHAWGARAEALPWLDRLDEAFAAAARVNALDPNDIAYLAIMSWLRFLAGQPEEALAAAQQMVRINPPGGPQEAIMLCRANLLLGRYGDAVPACERATTFLDASWRNYVMLAAAYGQRGDLDKAAATRSELLKRQPGYTIAKDKARPFSKNPEYLRLLELHFYPGLRKAGLAEQ